MNQPLPDPSPLPWTYDKADNVIRASDGTEVCRFPTAKAYPIDIANGRLISGLTVQFCRRWQDQQQQTQEIPHD